MCEVGGRRKEEQKIDIYFNILFIAVVLTILEYVPLALAIFIMGDLGLIRWIVKQIVMNRYIVIPLLCGFNYSIGIFIFWYVFRNK